MRSLTSCCRPWSAAGPVFPPFLLLFRTTGLYGRSAGYTRWTRAGMISRTFCTLVGFYHLNPLAGNGGMLRNPRTQQDSLCHSLTHALAVYILRDAQLSFTVLSCPAAPSCVEVVT